MSDAAQAGLRARWTAIDPWLRRTVLVAVASRVLVLCAGFAATFIWTTTTVDQIQRFPARAEVYRGWLGHLVNPWAHWDAVWFIHIANDGYHTANGTPAFYPLYPALLWLASQVTGHEFELTGIALSLALYIAASVLLFRLLALDLSPRIAFWGVTLLAVFPASFFFQTVYSESLFLLLTVACFWFLRRRSWALAGLCGLLATVTRLAGLLLLIPLAVELWRARRDGRLSLAGTLSLLLPPLGVVLYAGYLRVALGDFFVAGAAETRWGRQLTFPLVTVWRAFTESYHGLGYLVAGPESPEPAQVTAALSVVRRETAIVDLVSLATLLVAVWALTVGWRRLPLSYSLFALSAILLPLTAPRHQFPLTSLPRFLAVAFPLFAGLAAWTNTKPRTRWALTGVFTAGLVFCTARFALWLFVA